MERDKEDLFQTIKEEKCNTIPIVIILASIYHGDWEEMGAKIPEFFCVF